MSALGTMALRARKRMIFDCILMSLSLRDLSPEIVVLVVPDIFPNAITPTPSTAMVRSRVMSARAMPAVSVRVPHSAASAVRVSLILMRSPFLVVLVRKTECYQEAARGNIRLIRFGWNVSRAWGSLRREGERGLRLVRCPPCGTGQAAASLREARLRSC